MVNTPKIRFKGFEDEWEQCKLNDISEIVTGTTPPTKDKDNYGGDKLFVSPADIQGNRYVNNTFTTLTEKGFNLGRKLRPGSSLFVSIGSTIGKVAQIKDFVTTNQQINAIMPLEFMDDNYTFSMLEKEANKIKKLSAQQAVPIINKSTFENIEIICPIKEEQVKIGVYFLCLDQLITIRQRNCDETKKLKKYMLQKMFPQNGKKIPEIRFAGFVNDWEQRKLDDWGTFYYGKSCPKWSVTEDATIPCVRYGELYTKFGTKIDKVYSYTNMPPDNLRFSKGTEVLIPRVGEDPMDYNHCAWLSIPNVAIGEMISVFNTKNNPLFTATMFNATFQKEFAMRVEGGSVTNLYFEKLKNIEALFPALEEQEKIADYFSKLDNLITLHQRKCDELKEVKKFMLQNMFPQKG